MAEKKGAPPNDLATKFTLGIAELLISAAEEDETQDWD